MADAEANGERLRVAYLIDVFPRPSNTFIFEQMAGVMARGHDVDIYARSLLPGGLDHQDGVAGRFKADQLRHIRVPTGRLARAKGLARGLLERDVRWPAMARELVRPPFTAGKVSWLYTALSFARVERYDVVHAQFGTLAPMAAAMRRSGALRGALVVSFRGADATSILRSDPHHYDRVFRSADLLLPVSEYLKAKLVAAGSPPERTIVHHSGIDLAQFAFHERGGADAEPRCLLVGRLTDKKGIRYALEALALVRDRGIPARLDIAGEGDDLARLQRVSDDLGLSGAVRFLGRLTPVEVRAAMRRANILLAPSVTARDGDQEGIPNVLKEGMACGLPVLATFHSGIPELVEDGVSGLLVPERDSEALADAWYELAQHPERWGAMGRAGRAAVEKGFAAEALTTDLIALYGSARERWMTRASGSKGR